MERDNRMISEEALNKAAKKLKQMDEVVKGYSSLLIVTHDSPDPDSLAGAAVLGRILGERSGINCKIGYGGFIGRAENRAMVKYLKIKVSRLNRLKTDRRQAYALVDTQPGSGNNSLPAGIKPLIVIDHHPLRRQTVPFLDVRPDYGASATILTEYLLASGLAITAQMATGLAYAIISETEDLGREASQADIEAYLSLFPKANQRILSRIRHPKLPVYYFVCLQKAIANAFIYRNIIGSRLGRIEHPDLVPQVADLLIAHERMGWSICTGRYKGEVYISIRTINVKAEAGRLLRRIVNRRGTAGGHGMIAGGRISCQGLSETECEEAENKIIRRFLEKLGHRGEIMFKPLLSLKGN